MHLPDPQRLRDWAVHELAREAMGELLAAAAKADIAIAPVKGVVLARRAYGDVVERPMNDADALVRRRDLRPLARLAAARGWPTVHDSTTLGCVNVVVSSVAIDIASAIKPVGICALALDELFARATVRTDLFAAPHLELDWNDHLLVLTADAFKDKLDAKPHARVDLLRMVEHPAFDRDAFVARSARGKVVTMVRAVADWLLETQRSPAWEAIRAALPRAQIREDYLARWHRLRRSRPRPASLDGYRLAVATRLVSDSPRQRALALALGAAGAAAFVLRHGSLGAQVWSEHRAR